MPSLYTNKFCKIWEMIWPGIEFKKSLDIFWPRLQRRRSEEYLDHFDVQVEALRVTSRLEFTLKNSNWNTATICEVLFMTRDFYKTLHSQCISPWINITGLSNVSLNYIIFLFWLFVKIFFLSLSRLLFSVVNDHRMQENSKCHVYQMNFYN